MTQEERDTVFKRCICEYGMQPQVDMCIEEMSELTKALLKWRSETIYLECIREFQDKYFSMKPNEWRHLVGDYVREVTERPELQETETFRFVMAG